MTAGPISGGLRYLKIGANQYQTRGSVKVMIQNYVNTADANADGSVFVTSKPVVPGISGVLSDSGGLALADIIAVSGETIKVYLMNGKSYVLTNAIFCGDAALNNEDGTIPFEFRGTNCNEQVAS